LHPAERGVAPRSPLRIDAPSTLAYKPMRSNRYFAYSFFITSPPFITNLTCSSVVTYRKGSPSTAIMSHLPASIVPILSAQPTRSAAFNVPSLNRLQRREAHLCHFCEFMPVQAVRVYSRVCSECYPYAGLERMRNILLRDRYQRPPFFHHVGSPPESLHVLYDPVFEIDRWHKISSALFHQLNALIVEVASVLDGIDAREHRVFDPNRPMRVRRNFAPEPVRGFDDGLQFLRAALRLRWIVAFRDRSAGGHNFDNIHAERDVLADLFHDCRDAICDAPIRESELRREKVSVPVAARDAQRRPGNQHASAWHIPCIDSIAQSEVRISVRGHVSHRRESCLESYASVPRSEQSAARIGHMKTGRAP
jgi:hypothetical protein